MALMASPRCHARVASASAPAAATAIQTRALPIFIGFLLLRAGLFCLSNEHCAIGEVFCNNAGRDNTRHGVLSLNPEAPSPGAAYEIPSGDHAGFSLCGGNHHAQT